MLLTPSLVRLLSTLPLLFFLLLMHGPTTFLSSLKVCVLSSLVRLPPPPGMILIHSAPTNLCASPTSSGPHSLISLTQFYLLTQNYSHLICPYYASVNVTISLISFTLQQFHEGGDHIWIWSLWNIRLSHYKNSIRFITLINCMPLSSFKRNVRDFVCLFVSITEP